MTARSSQDIIIEANQRQTRVWWDERHKFDLYVSQVVLLEIGAGDLSAAQSRLALVREIPRLDLTKGCYMLAREILREAALPRRAERDALHIATAAVYQIDFLVTWNCRHIANAILIPRIAAILKARGFEIPLICTPPQLLGRNHDEERNTLA